VDVWTPHRLHGDGGLADRRRGHHHQPLTAAALVAYFLAALGAHARVNDKPVRYAPAAGMLAWSIVALRAYPVAGSND
jgi:hypothetical protein